MFLVTLFLETSLKQLIKKKSLKNKKFEKCAYFQEALGVAF